MANAKYIVTDRLGRTVDGRIVPYESPEAAFLAYFPGQEISMDVALAEGLFKAYTGEMGERPDNAEPGIQVTDPDCYEDGVVPDPCIEAASGLQILVLDDQIAEEQESAMETTDEAVENAAVDGGIMAAEEQETTDEAVENAAVDAPQTKPVRADRAAKK